MNWHQAIAWLRENRDGGRIRYVDMKSWEEPIMLDKHGYLCFDNQAEDPVTIDEIFHRQFVGCYA